MTFDYTALAELYPTRSYKRRAGCVTYKRFEVAAEAVRFAGVQVIDDGHAEGDAFQRVRCDEGNLSARERRLAAGQENRAGLGRTAEGNAEEERVADETLGIGGEWRLRCWAVELGAQGSANDDAAGAVADGIKAVIRVGLPLQRTRRAALQTARA